MPEVRASVGLKDDAAGVDVVDKVVVDIFQPVNFLEVEGRVFVLASDSRYAMDHIRLVLEDVVHMSVLAQVVW